MATQHDYSAKGIFWLLLNCILVLVMVFGLISIGTMIRYANAIVPSRTISVTGEGKTEMAPDLATYSFSVVSQGADPARIQQENTKKMNDAIGSVREDGIKEADIKTTGYNLYPRYTYNKDTGRQSIDGYELTQTVSIKIRDLTKVGQILGDLLKAGVNQAGSLQYTIENPEAQRALARQEAFMNAYAKASVMAAQNGVRVARVITFSESTNSNGPIFYDKAVPMAASMGGEGAPNTQPGTEEVSVNVSVTYEIR